MANIRPLVVLLCLICAQLALADEKNVQAPVSATKILTLSDAIAEALANNPRIDAANHESRSREHNISPQAALDDPMLAFELEDYSTTTSPVRSMDAGNKLSFTQIIPFPGKREARRLIAAHEFYQATHEAEQLRRETIRLLKRSYIELSLALTLREVLTEQLQLTRSTLRNAQTNYSLSKGTQTDVLTLNVEEASLRSRLVSAEQEILQLETEVTHLLGRASGEHWRTEKLKPSIVPVDVSMDGLLQRALANNPRLKAVDANIARTQSEVVLAKAERYPNFQVMAAYKSQRSSGFQSNDDMVSAGVGVTLPLWRGEKQDKIVAKAEEDRQKEMALLREEQNDVVHAVHFAFDTIRLSQKSITVARESLLPLANAAIESAQRAYESGGSELLPVLNLVNARFDSQRNYFRAVAQHEVSLADLEALVGGPISAEGEL